jgi:hypothetical protein
VFGYAPDSTIMEEFSFDPRNVIYPPNITDKEDYLEAKCACDFVEWAVKMADSYCNEEELRKWNGYDAWFKSNTHCSHCGRVFTKDNMQVEHHYHDKKGINVADFALCKGCNVNASHSDKYKTVFFAANVTYEGCGLIRELKMYNDKLIAQGKMPPEHEILASTSETIKSLTIKP